MSDQHQEYDDTFVGVLELVWGEGYLSPGGEDEVAAVIEIAGREVADHEVMIWEAMIDALDAGDLRPTHWYARKP